MSFWLNIFFIITSFFALDAFGNQTEDLTSKVIFLLAAISFIGVMGYQVFLWSRKNLR